MSDKMTPRIFADGKYYNQITHDEYCTRSFSDIIDKKVITFELDPNQEPEGEDASMGKYFFASIPDTPAPKADGQDEVAKLKEEVETLKHTYNQLFAAYQELKKKLEFEYEVQEAGYQERKGLKAELEKTKFDLKLWMDSACELEKANDKLKDNTPAPTDGDWVLCWNEMVGFENGKLTGEILPEYEYRQIMMRRRKVEPTMPDILPGDRVWGNSAWHTVSHIEREGMIYAYDKNNKCNSQTCVNNVETIKRQGKKIWEKA